MLNLTPLIRAAEFRLVEDSFFQVGNRWEERSHYLKEENVPVDYYVDEYTMIVRTDTRFGRDVYVQVNEEGRELYFWITDRFIHLFQESFFGGELGDEDIEYLDEQEDLPLFVNDTDVNRHYGHAELHTVTVEAEFDTTLDKFITFAGLDTITVPAGTFDVIKIDLRTEWITTIGWRGTLTRTLWIDPAVGVIRGHEIDRWFDPEAGMFFEDEEEWELIWTNVNQPKLQISGQTGAPGAVLEFALDGGGVIGRAIADETGFYSFAEVPQRWIGSVTPNHPDFTFSPAIRDYIRLEEDLDNQNFTPLMKLSTKVRDYILDRGTLSDAEAIQADDNLDTKLDIADFVKLRTQGR